MIFLSTYWPLSNEIQLYPSNISITGYDIKLHPGRVERSRVGLVKSQLTSTKCAHVITSIHSTSGGTLQIIEVSEKDRK